MPGGLQELELRHAHFCDRLITPCDLTLAARYDVQSNTFNDFLEMRKAPELSYDMYRVFIIISSCGSKDAIRGMA